MCTEALDDDLSCVWPTANNVPLIMKWRMPLCPLVSFMGSTAGPVETNIFFDSGKDLISYHASNRDNLADPEEKDSSTVQDHWAPLFMNRMTIQGAIPFPSLSGEDELGFTRGSPADDRVAAYLSP